MSHVITLAWLKESANQLNWLYAVPWLVGLITVGWECMPVLALSMYCWLFCSCNQFTRIDISDTWGTSAEECLDVAYHCLLYNVVKLTSSTLKIWNQVSFYCLLDGMRHVIIQAWLIESANQINRLFMLWRDWLGLFTVRLGKGCPSVLALSMYWCRGALSSSFNQFTSIFPQEGLDS